jgi:hypothetical protein
MVNRGAIIKLLFLKLFLLQLISVCYLFEYKSASIKLGDVSTEEGLGDFSTEDSEGEVDAEFYIIDNKNSSSNHFVCDVYQQTIYLSHNNQIPKPVYLEIPYSPPENKI